MHCCYISNVCPYTYGWLLGSGMSNSDAVTASGPGLEWNQSRHIQRPRWALPNPITYNDIRHIVGIRLETGTRLSDIVNTIVFDDLTTQDARASVAVMLTFPLYFSLPEATFGFEYCRCPCLSVSVSVFFVCVNVLVTIIATEISL